MLSITVAAGSATGFILNARNGKGMAQRRVPDPLPATRLEPQALPGAMIQLRLEEP